MVAIPSLHTVVAVVGCLLAGVAVVPVPPVAGVGERAHILADSGAQLWLGACPDDVRVPASAIDLRARSSRSHPEPDGAATGETRSGADALHEQRDAQCDHDEHGQRDHDETDDDHG